MEFYNILKPGYDIKFFTDKEYLEDMCSKSLVGTQYIDTDNIIKIETGVNEYYMRKDFLDKKLIGYNFMNEYYGFFILNILDDNCDQFKYNVIYLRYPTIAEECLEYFRNKYPNFILDEISFTRDIINYSANRPWTDIFETRFDNLLGRISPEDRLKFELKER